MVAAERGSLKCWGSGENNVLRDCLHRREDPQRLHNLEGEITVEDMAKSTPRIYAVLSNHQADHESTMLEV